MATLVTVIHVFVCLFLVLTVLLQPGKGSGMGGAFGGGSTQSVFGGSGGSSVLRKATVFVAALFMLSSMTLAWLASNTGADALKEFSAAERAKHERREALREAVLEGAEGTTEGMIEGADGEIETIPLGEEDAPTPEGDLDPEDLDTLLEEGDEAPGADEGAEPQGGEAPAGGSPAEGTAGGGGDPAEGGAQPEPSSGDSAGDETSP
jgi:preprotein translocase subunit SecG